MSIRRQHRTLHRNGAALLVTLAVVFTGLAGCAKPAVDESTDVSAVSGCWFPSSGWSNCRALISVSGRGPDGTSLTTKNGYFRLMSPGIVDKGLPVLVLEFSTAPPGACVIYQIPVNASPDGLWVPEKYRSSGPAAPCGNGENKWVRDFFRNPFSAKNIGPLVRFTSGDAFITFRWE